METETPRKPLHKRPKRHPAKLAEIAFNELHLSTSSWTQADRDRLWRVWRGLRWLDDDQANVRSEIDDLLEAYDKKQNVTKLVAGLRKLVAIPPEKMTPP